MVRIEASTNTLAFSLCHSLFVLFHLSLNDMIFNPFHRYLYLEQLTVRIFQHVLFFRL